VEPFDLYTLFTTHHEERPSSNYEETNGGWQPWQKKR